MDDKVCKILGEMDKEQKKMKEDLTSLEDDVKRMKDRYWEGYFPLYFLIGSYALMCYTSSYSKKAEPIIVPLDRDFNTIEFRR